MVSGSRWRPLSNHVKKQQQHFQQQQQHHHNQRPQTKTTAVEAAEAAAAAVKKVKNWTQTETAATTIKDQIEARRCFNAT